MSNFANSPFRNLNSFTKISANISKSKNEVSNEILFVVESKLSSKDQSLFLELSTNEATIRLDVWALPIGWLSDRPISIASVSHKSVHSTIKISPRKWHTFNLARHVVSLFYLFLFRNGNEIEVLFDGKSIIFIDLELFDNCVSNRTVFYIGKSPSMTFMI